MNEIIKRHIRRTSEQWQVLIEAQQQSNLSAKVFCGQRGVGYASFCNWRRRLLADKDRPSLDDKLETNFIDLSTLAESKSGGWHIVLKLDDGMELSLTKS